MPNWCNNVVEMTHADPVMIIRAKTALDRGELLQEFIPVPESLQITASPGTTDEVLKEQYSANIAKHGYANWYDWCVGEWGTKWDVGGDGVTELLEDGGLTTSFDSAWAPPIEAYAKLAELGFVIRAYYYEGGMCFAGVWDDGDDDYYDLSGMDSAAVAEQLPSALDEMFCISESMAEWEEENAEEDAE